MSLHLYALTSRTSVHEQLARVAPGTHNAYRHFFTEWENAIRRFPTNETLRLQRHDMLVASPDLYTFERYVQYGLGTIPTLCSVDSIVSRTIPTPKSRPIRGMTFAPLSIAGLLHLVGYRLPEELDIDDLGGVTWRERFTTRKATSLPKA